MVQQEPDLGSFVMGSILNHKTLEEAVAFRIAERLGHADVSSGHIRQAFARAFAAHTPWQQGLRADIMAVLQRDPVCNRVLEPVLYFKGFQAMQAYRLAHWLWEQDRKDFALYLQSRVSAIFQVDIHPAARFGYGIFLDHATGFVVGSTAVVEDNVSILQDVTLGGTGKEEGDRHPKIRRGVLIGAGAKILGNIEIGAGSLIAAGSVVLNAVPERTTVAGVPAKVVGIAPEREPAINMNQMLDAPDYFDPVI